MKHILVVEDDIEIANLLEFCLVKQGFEVSVSHDGESGLKIVQEHLPDLVLLDLNLPGMSGEEICREIKHSYDHALRNIPIMIITGKASDVDCVVGKVLGATLYLTKPFEIQELINKVNNLLAA